MSKDPALPPRVFPKGRAYYLVVADGKKRVWKRLSKISEGLPAMYRALAAIVEADQRTGTVPQLIADWETEVMPAHAEHTQTDDRARGKVIAEALADFLVSEVETPDCSDFLARFKAKPRTFNAYRGQLRELMRFAEEKGHRPAGSNPIAAIKTMPTPARDRYISDSELRRLKVAALRWNAGKADLDTRSGPMLCCLIDMAYLTGQAIGDLLALEWRDMRADGIFFARSKVAETTGAKVLIEWTPKLLDVKRRLAALRKERRAFGSKVFVRQDGQPYTYWGASSAWQRARKRAGITGCTFHDLKAKALTDKEAREGMRAASAMGQHSTEQQTAAYVRRRSGRKVGATR
jgi:integrase